MSLYVCGFENRNGVRDGSWYRLAQEAATKIGKPIRRGEHQVLAFGHVEDESRQPAPHTSALQTPPPSWAHRAAPPEHITPRLIRPSDAAGARESPALSPLEGARRFRRGQVAHLFLARLPDLPPEKRGLAAIAFAAQNGFGRELADETLVVISHPDFAAAFAPGSQAEVAFQAAVSRPPE